MKMESGNMLSYIIKNENDNGSKRSQVCYSKNNKIKNDMELCFTIIY